MPIFFIKSLLTSLFQTTVGALSKGGSPLLGGVQGWVPLFGKEGLGRFIQCKSYCETLYSFWRMS